MHKLFYVACLFKVFMINGDISTIWRQMQSDYLSVKDMPEYKNSFKYTNGFYNQLVIDLDKLVMGVPNIDFLNKSCLTSVMVRAAVDELSLYEETFLSECIDNKTKQYISEFKENNQGLLDSNCSKFNCSSTTLGHLYYVAKVLELSGGDCIETILEVGGGFGNLAKCFKKILSNCTVVIVDLPEMCVIQKMFLNYTTPEINVLLHKKSGQAVRQGSINLVPLCFLEGIVFKPDLFISTFALSESPSSMQNYIVDNNFFNAKRVYITGQINGWHGIGHNWMLNHDLILEAVRKNYNHPLCVPFHWIKKGFLSYEIYGKL